MSDHHDHDESSYPFLWNVLDVAGKRITVLVSHTLLEADTIAAQLMGSRPYTVVNTGKRKPPNKCCTTCGEKPCS